MSRLIFMSQIFAIVGFVLRRERARWLVLRWYRTRGRDFDAGWSGRCRLSLWDEGRLPVNCNRRNCRKTQTRGEGKKSHNCWITEIWRFYDIIKFSSSKAKRKQRLQHLPAECYVYQDESPSLSSDLFIIRFISSSRTHFTLKTLKTIIYFKDIQGQWHRLSITLNRILW